MRLALHHASISLSRTQKHSRAASSKRLASQTHGPAPHMHAKDHAHAICAAAGEVLLGDLYRAGFTVVDEHEESDAIIVNTCGFVEDAKTESLEVSAQGRPTGGSRFSMPSGGQGKVPSGPSAQNREEEAGPAAGQNTGTSSPTLSFPQNLRSPSSPRRPLLPSCSARPQAVMAAAALNEDGKQRKVIVTGCLAQRYSDQLAKDLPEADLVMGFEQYGNLGNALRHTMGMGEVSADEYAQRSRVQVRVDGVWTVCERCGRWRWGASRGVVLTVRGVGRTQKFAFFATYTQSFPLIPSHPLSPTRPLTLSFTLMLSLSQVGEATVAFRPEWDRFRLTPKHTAYLRVAEGCNHACTFCAIPGFR